MTLITNSRNAGILITKNSKSVEKKLNLQISDEKVIKLVTDFREQRHTKQNWTSGAAGPRAHARPHHGPSVAHV